MNENLRNLAWDRMDEIEERLESDNAYLAFKIEYEKLYNKIEGMLGEDRLLLDCLTANLISIYAEIGINAYVQGVEDSKSFR